jgi:tRNA A-37 threonylcarbamoyl transferase component Bud32/membrane-associated phospholipid phosphatase
MSNQEYDRRAPMDGETETSSFPPAGDRRISGKRRRPSGEPPPLPRELGVSGKLWVGFAAILFTIAALVVVYASFGHRFDRWNSLFLQRLMALRAGWLDPAMTRVDDVLSSEWTVGILRLATMVALVVFRRWRHLLVFVASVVIVESLAYELSIFVASPRPDGVRIIGSWEGPSFPSPPVAALAVTLVGMIYTLLPPGRPRSWGKWAAGAILLLYSFARLYEAVDHPTDILSGLILGVGIPVVAFRVFTPNEVFPVTYRRGRAAHLDVGGRRGEAIRRAVRDQLGLTVLEAKPIGLEGSGGSTPLRLRVAARNEEPERHIFAKLYAKSHVRADRSYKLGRAILYGALEDEAPFQSVRRFVEYEDYMLLLLQHLGLPTPTPYGFVEITPEREYMILMEFFDGATEIGDAVIDDGVTDEGLSLVRRLWDAGLAHRDIKPANLMVRDGRLLLIDVFFMQVRPSPWRQAVDLANMMLVLALRTDADLVYRHALKYFSDQEIAEAFAAAGGVASPTQLRAALKRDSRDLLSEFRALAPERSPVAIQRWSVRRLVLGLSVLAVGGLLMLVVIGNWRVVV